MKTALMIVLFMAGVIACVLVVRKNTARQLASDAPLISPDRSSADNPATKSVPRTDAWWTDRHQAIVSQVIEGDAQLIFLGDSIIQNFEKNKPPDQVYATIWSEFYADRHAINMGFSGDETGNLLWRIENGELMGIHPKVAVILIGTNNTATLHQTPDQVEAGIEAVVDTVLLKLHRTKILLLGILPSDLPDKPGKADQDEAINRLLAREYKGLDEVTFLDVSPAFMKYGKVNLDLFIDPTLPAIDGKVNGALHPNPAGQRRLAEMIEPTLSHLLGDQSKLGKANAGL